MDIKKYKHNATYSYTLGMTLTIELMQNQRNIIEKIYVHPDYKAKDENYNIFRMCEELGLPCENNVKVFNRLALKENTFVLGVFHKFAAPVLTTVPHVVLVNPSDAGNLGTIIRTGVGFGFRDFVIISPGVDIYDPKAVRASMGAFFHCRFSYYNSFEEYMQQHTNHLPYSFMLNGKTNLREVKERPQQLFSLVFGNEATGLPDEFYNYGESIYIKHGHEIDSLNLSIAFGIAANTFAG